MQWDALINLRVTICTDHTGPGGRAKCSSFGAVEEKCVKALRCHQMSLGAVLHQRIRSVHLTAKVPMELGLSYVLQIVFPRLPLDEALLPMEKLQAQKTVKSCKDEYKLFAVMDNFHDLFITHHHFFLDLYIIHVVNREHSGCCSLSHAILIYLRKASLKLEKEGRKHISSDLPSNLTISSLTAFANSSGRKKKERTE